MENVFDLLEERLARLAKARFGEATEIQRKMIPLVLEGKNVLGIAPTGFGKTEAAFLPVLSNLLKSDFFEGIRFLYVTPLKALNRDLLERMQYWCKLTGVSLAVRHGDTSASERVKQRDNPPAVLVTTPETLNSLLIGPLRNALRNVGWVVVDEVHELVDSKRGLQLSLALERLKERVKEKVEEKIVGVAGENKEKKLQIIGLSATVGSPEKVAEFLAKDCVAVKSALERKIDLRIEFPTKGSYGEFTKLWSLDALSGARVARIRQLIDSHENTLLFVNTRSLAESLASLLFQAEELKSIIGVHHGSLAREARLEAETKFKQQEAGGLKAIICTSSLELGIDVGKVNLVIQYHSPRQASRLLQRVGRSGHSKQKTPKGIVLAVSGMDCVESAVLARQALAGELEETRWEENAFDILAHQVVGAVLEGTDEKNHGSLTIKTQKIYEIMKRALPYRNLSAQAFLMVCKQMKNQRLLAVSQDFSELAATRASKLYYYENVSSIADSRKYFVKNAGDRKNVALLDEDFVAEYLQEGAVFITRGIPWKVLSVAEDEVVVEQSGDYSAAIPDWVGEEIPVSFSASQQAGELLKKAREMKEGELEKEFYCDENSAKKIVEFAQEQQKHFVPEKGKVFVEAGGRTIVLHTFAGNKANEALAKVLSSLCAEKTRASVLTRVSPYSIAFDFAKNLEAGKFAELVGQLKPAEVEKILLKALPGSALFRKMFADVARRFGLLQKNADLRAINLKKLVEAHAHTPVWEEAMQEILFDRLDAKGAARVLSETRQVVLVDRPEFSPIAREFVEIKGFGEMFAPMQASEQLLEAFKKSLLARRSELVCNYCSQTFSKQNSELPEKLKCPSCGSTQLTLAEFAEVLEKNSKGRELTTSERKQLVEARRVESLFEAYGSKAAVALSTYGVGPETAARMLGRLREDETDFYNDLLEAQKSFVRTRKFWKI